MVIICFSWKRIYSILLYFMLSESFREKTHSPRVTNIIEPTKSEQNNPPHFEYAVSAKKTTLPKINTGPSSRILNAACRHIYPLRPRVESSKSVSETATVSSPHSPAASTCNTQRRGFRNSGRKSRDPVALRSWLARSRFGRAVGEERSRNLFLI